jgi:hypothetical protein
MALGLMDKMELVLAIMLDCPEEEQEVDMLTLLETLPMEEMEVITVEAAAAAALRWIPLGTVGLEELELMV